MNKKHLTLVVPIPSKCVRCDTRQEGLCSALDPGQLKRLSQRAVRQHVKAGTSLILKGDKGSIHTSLVHGGLS